MPSRGPIRPTRVDIDLDAIRHNARRLKSVAPGVRVWAIIKADAYGHGAVEVARALNGIADGFGVSLVEEGSQLRDAGIDAPILVMGPALDKGHAEIVERDMTPMVSDWSDVEAFAQIGRDRNAPVSVHLKLDTGMGRLGIQEAQIAPAPQGVQIDALATHFACADTDDPADPDSMTRRQLARFDELCAAAKRHGIDPPIRHAANSAATLEFPQARLDWIRPGLALYGNAADSELLQAMRLVTHVAQIRDVPVGTTVSYQALWKAERPSRLAVLPVGYADGFPRALTGKAEVLVAGKRCAVVGAICMDITVVDVTSLGDAAAVGDEVVLLGAQGDERITAGEFAARSGLIEYEVTCGISKRVPRAHSS